MVFNWGIFFHVTYFDQSGASKKYLMDYKLRYLFIIYLRREQFSESSFTTPSFQNWGINHLGILLGYFPVLAGTYSVM